MLCSIFDTSDDELNSINEHDFVIGALTDRFISYDFSGIARNLSAGSLKVSGFRLNPGPVYSGLVSSGQTGFGVFWGIILLKFFVCKQGQSESGSAVFASSA